MATNPDLKTVTDQNPARTAESRAHVKRAEEFFELAEKGESPQENWKSVLQEYEKAASLGSLDATDYKNWGVAFARLKQDEQALNKYQAAAQKYQQEAPADPGYSQAYVNCGNALFRLKRYTEAIQSYEKATQIPAPNHIEAFNGWGNALYESNQPHEAIAKYLRAMEEDPRKVDYPRWVNSLGQIEARERQKAIDEAEKDIGRNNEFSSAYRNWADALFNLNQYDDSIAMYRRALAISPEDGAALNGVGRVLLTWGRHREAAEYFKQAAGFKADSIYFYNWGLALARLKDYGQASEKFRQASQLVPNADTYTQWGTALYQAKDFPAARSKYLEAMKYDPTVVDYQNWVAVLDRAEAQERQQAINEAEGRIAQKPAFVDAYNFWGYALSRLKRHEEAVRMYEKAVAINPDNANSYANWGNALFDQDQYREARAKYLQAMQYDPTVVDYSRWVSLLAKLRAEDRAEAAGKAEQAIARKPEYLGACSAWGYYLGVLSNYEPAVEKLSKVVSSVPVQGSVSKEMKTILADAYNYWGILLTNQQKYREAFDKFEKAIEAKKDLIYIWQNWAAGLVNQKRYREAVVKCETARRIDPQATNTYLIWGNALVGLGLYEEGLDKYREATRLDPDYAYAYHNIADARSKHGNYRLAAREWNLAREAYEKGRQNARAGRDPDFFWYCGGALHESLHDFRRAEEVYKEGLAISPNHPGLLIGLGDLRLAQRDNTPATEGSLPAFADGGNAQQRQTPPSRTTLYWEAREFYKKAETALKARLDQSAEDVISSVQLGRIYLQVEDYDQAKQVFLRARDQNRESPDVLNGLGAVCMKLEDFAQAARYFTDALRFSPDSLSIRSNLAEAYLKLGQNQKALEEYKKITQIAPDHLESLVGLGQIYTNLGEDGDEDMLQEAINQFEEAIQKSKSGEASKVFSKAELGAIYYSLGYARIQLYQISKSAGEDYLPKALKDFKNAVDNAPDHQKARIAVGKLESRIKPSSPEKFWERWGSLLLVLFCGFLFGFAQLKFYWKWPRGAAEMSFDAYSVMTFGSLLLMVAGFYLPRILKLKVAGVELEKSVVDQVATSSPLKISKS